MYSRNEKYKYNHCISTFYLSIKQHRVLLYMFINDAKIYVITIYLNKSQLFVENIIRSFTYMLNKISYNNLKCSFITSDTITIIVLKLFIIIYIYFIFCSYCQVVFIIHKRHTYVVISFVDFIIFYVFIYVIVC
jgi:hypothetical protein